jgi:hypothetical protein
MDSRKVTTRSLVVSAALARPIAFMKNDTNACRENWYMWSINTSWINRKYNQAPSLDTRRNSLRAELMEISCFLASSTFCSISVDACLVFSNPSMSDTSLRMSSGALDKRSSNSFSRSVNDTM